MDYYHSIKKARDRLNFHKRVLEGRAGKGRGKNLTREQMQTNVDDAMRALNILISKQASAQNIDEANTELSMSARYLKENEYLNSQVTALDLHKSLEDYLSSIYGIKHETREAWLSCFIEASRFVFRGAGYELPTNIKISIGFPSTAALSETKRRIGECWSNDTSGGYDIFISPLIDHRDTIKIAGVGTHEACHAAVGIKCGHRKPFTTCAESVGLVGKATEMMPGPYWHDLHSEILATLGPLPHVMLTPNEKKLKKQSTRNLKCKCPECGFTFRSTAKWLEGVEALDCPSRTCDGVIPVNAPDQDGDDE